jgi:hypothetical protein
VKKIVLFLVLISLFVYGYDTQNSIVRKLKREVIPISRTLFQVIDLETGIDRYVDLQGQDFIVVSVREEGSDGRFYAVDRDGTVWLSGAVTSGAPQYRSPSGIFHILRKARYHMSNTYPDESGINNMDYSLFFTKYGHALHKGSTNWLSRGCIHIQEKDIKSLFNWANRKTKIVITRHTYMPFAISDLKRIYIK